MRGKRGLATKELKKQNKTGGWICGVRSDSCLERFILFLENIRGAFFFLTRQVFFSFLLFCINPFIQRVLCCINCWDNRFALYFCTTTVCKWWNQSKINPFQDYLKRKKIWFWNHVCVSTNWLFQFSLDKTWMLDSVEGLQFLFETQGKRQVSVTTV